MSGQRDRDAAGRARNARARDDLGRPLARLDPDPPEHEVALAPSATLVSAQRLLDDGRPFAAHEVLEAAWKAAPDPERELWRGLAQLAVGITHSLRGNDTGAAALLRRAAASLAPYDGTSPFDIDVDGLRRWAAETATEPGRASSPPRLRR